EALELAGRERLRIAHDAALRTPERKTHEGALPRHPHREGLDLVERDVRVVADASLRWPARDVVRHAEPAVHLGRPVLHRDRDRDLDSLLAPGEHAYEVRVEGEDLADVLELCLGELVRVLTEMGFRRGG